MFYFLFVFIVAIPRAAAELNNIVIFKTSAEVFRVLLYDGLALYGFLGVVSVLNELKNKRYWTHHREIARK